MGSNKPSDVDEHRAYVTSELTRMLDAGEWPERAAARLGYANADNLGRALYRWEQSDLAARMHVEVAA